MIFVMDVGNTQTTVALYSKSQLVDSWRLSTARHRTQDEWGSILHLLFHANRLDMTDVRGVAISSVVPPADAPLRQMSRRYFKCEPLFVAPGIKTGVPILYDNPSEVGADRIVNAVAAWERWRQALIVVDFGTATTFDAISARGEYLGGAICPGVGISMEALFRSASKLPRVEIGRALAAADRANNAVLQEKGGGIHHILFEVKDMDLAVRKLAPKGIEVLQAGTGIRPGTKWALLDTQGLIGFLLELRHRAPGCDGTSIPNDL